jgi:hypothetical protein
MPRISLKYTILQIIEMIGIATMFNIIIKMMALMILEISVTLQKLQPLPPLQIQTGLTLTSNMQKSFQSQ